MSSIDGIVSTIKRRYTKKEYLDRRLYREIQKLNIHTRAVNTLCMNCISLDDLLDMSIAELYSIYGIGTQYVIDIIDTLIIDGYIECNLVNEYFNNTSGILTTKELNDIQVRFCLNHKDRTNFYVDNRYKLTDREFVLSQLGKKVM